MRYRLFSIDENGQSFGAVNISCSSHVEALALAETELGDCRRELWFGADRIAVLPLDHTKLSS